MKVHSKENGQIEFLHILAQGALGESYGVKVAELAGLPKEIVQRAAELLKTFESPQVQSGKNAIKGKPAVNQINQLNQMSLFDSALAPIDKEKQKLIDELKMFSVLKTSPLEALNQIAKWQEKLN